MLGSVHSSMISQSCLLGDFSHTHVPESPNHTQSRSLSQSFRSSPNVSSGKSLSDSRAKRGVHGEKGIWNVIIRSPPCPSRRLAALRVSKTTRTDIRMRSNASPCYLQKVEYRRYDDRPSGQVEMEGGTRLLIQCLSYPLYRYSFSHREYGLILLTIILRPISQDHLPFAHMHCCMSPPSRYPACTALPL